MPINIDKNKLDRMIKMIDEYLARREQDKLNGYDDEDDEEDDNCDIENPLDAPPSAPFADSPPEHIHGAGNKKDLFS